MVETFWPSAVAANARRLSATAKQTDAVKRQKIRRVRRLKLIRDPLNILCPDIARVPRLGPYAVALCEWLALLCK